MTVPVIPAWMVQWNGYDPTVEKVRVCDPELIVPMSPPAGAAPSKTTLCATPDELVNVTVAPLETVRLVGAKLPVPLE